MSCLEVLQYSPTEKKLLLNTLGVTDLNDSHLMTFNMDNSKPKLPFVVVFYFFVIIHHCIVDEGASSCVMSMHVWKKLGSPKLNSPNISL